MRQDVIDELRRSGGHPPTSTTGTKPASFTRKRDERFGVTALALKPRKAAVANSSSGQRLSLWRTAVQQFMSCQRLSLER
jgi:hypothetical protein